MIIVHFNYHYYVYLTIINHYMNFLIPARTVDRSGFTLAAVQKLLYNQVLAQG